MTKVYTKTGDKGTTSLVGGERVSKIDERVEAYGTVDELGSFTAYLSDHLRSDEELAEYLGDLDRVASQLMSVAALLAVGHGGEGKLPDISPEAIGYLEERIDAMQSRVRPITKFTIPGGHPTVSLCHVCRTVCRRAGTRQPARSSTSPHDQCQHAGLPQPAVGLLLPAGTRAHGVLQGRRDTLAPVTHRRTPCKAGRQQNFRRAVVVSYEKRARQNIFISARRFFEDLFAGSIFFIFLHLRTVGNVFRTFPAAELKT